MFRFEEPTYLYLLAALPLIAILRWVLERKQLKRLKLFGDPTLLRHLMPDVSKMRPVVKFWMLLAAMALIIVMMARPQMGTRISHEKRTGIESIIAMDISNSMLAEDVTPSRLDRTKMMVENLVDNFTDDKIGLIVFAGDAFVQLPITSDYVSAKMFLSEIEPSLIATQGTDIATAINMAANSFTQQQGVGKAIIVITDGEDHEGGALEAAKAAKKKGMRVYVLGVGSDKGAPIPLGNGDYMKDRTGNTVMTKLNEEMCRQIAEAGGGAYIHVDNNTNAQRQLDSELAKLSKKEMQSTIYSDYDEQFQAFGIIAIILLILEICILESKNPIARRLNIFGRKQRTTTLIVALLVASASFAQNDRRYITQGNKLFRSGQFDKAEVAYRKAIEKNPRNPQAHYNLGNSLMAQKKDTAAVQSFQKSTELETSKIRKAMAFHNMGVVCQQHKMYGEAIEAYKSSLRLNPKDDATRYNLELCKRQQRNQKDQDKQDQNKQKDKNGNDKKDEKQKNKDKQDQKKNNNENKMSKENAEQMLNAAMQQEKSTQQRMKKAMQKPRTNKLDKEW